MSGHADGRVDRPVALVSAEALHDLGYRVLEAADTIGGGLRTQEGTLPGFRHDVCSAVHPAAVSSPFSAAVSTFFVRVCSSLRTILLRWRAFSFWRLRLIWLLMLATWGTSGVAKMACAQGRARKRTW